MRCDDALFADTAETTESALFIFLAEAVLLAAAETVTLSFETVTAVTAVDAVLADCPWIVLILVDDAVLAL